MRLFVLVAAILVLFSGSVHAESAINRVNKTNSIRCGYIEYLPALTKDLKTNEWSGFDYEIMQAVSNRMQLKVEYVAETGWGTVVADLSAKKFDMLCGGFWVHPNVARFALFSRPIFFQPVFIVARANDGRFEKNANLNDAKLTMVALDGDNPVNIAQADFPLAHILALPAMSDYSQVLINVANGKADFTIVDAQAFGNYNKNNPGKLKIMSPDKPVRVYPVSYAFGAGEGDFRDAVNATLDELILDGTIDRILKKYDVYPNSYYRAVVTYINTYKSH